MEKKQISQKFRERYGLDKSDEFYIRIRKNSNDIIYYHGIKVFELQKDLTIVIDPSIYLVNSKNYQQVEKIQTIRNRLKMNTGINFCLKSIKLEGNITSYDESKARTIYQDILMELKRKDLVNYILEKPYEKNLKICIDSSTPFKKIIELEEVFMKNCCQNQGLGSPVSEMELIVPEDLAKKLSEDMKMWDKFDLSIKKAVETYEKITTKELEKYYQHQWMISKNVFGKFSNFKHIYRFEEEYYTFDSESVKTSDSSTLVNRGRIDNVFIQIGKEKSEVYLIELKVNDSVLTGKNGVNKHLIDMENLCKNKKNKEMFLNTLEKRVNYRREVLKESPIVLDKKMIHFITIVAFSKDNASKVFSKMQKLEDINFIMNEQKKVSDPLPIGSMVLKEHQKTLRKYGCEVSILFDVWEEEELLSYPLLSQMG